MNEIALDLRSLFPSPLFTADIDWDEVRELVEASNNGKEVVE